MADAREMLKEAQRLEAEAATVHLELRKLWGTDKDSEGRHFPFTSTGLTMCAFGIIDRWARFWFPDEGDMNKRIVAFLAKYVYPTRPKDVLEVAIQLWRHKAVHNAKLEVITEKQTGKRYKWWFHYESSNDQNLTLQAPDSNGVICVNLGLGCFLTDLCVGLQAAIDDLGQTPEANCRIQEWETKKKESFSYLGKF